MLPWEDLRQAIIVGQAARARELTELALAGGLAPAEFFPNAIVPAMDEVGRRMRDCEFFVPQVLIAARAARTVIDRLRPLLLQDAAAAAAGRVVCCTVQGDLHDIGKNIVAMMLESAGFAIVDLGTDVAPEQLVEAVRRHRPQLLAMSALLTTTMVNMKTAIDALAAARLRSGLKIMVGGAAVTESWARQIGADGYGPDAFAAVALARRLSLIAI